FRWQAGDGGPWMFVPPGQRSQLQVLWTVPGFGSLVCHATHAGQGLAAGDAPEGIDAAPEGIDAAPDGTLELWLNEDLALSACARLESVWAQAEADGYHFDEQVQSDRRTALMQCDALQAI